MVGAPHFLSMTTLRPRGPSVTFTVSASLLTPRSSARLASSSNSRILGIKISSTSGWIEFREQTTGQDQPACPVVPRALLVDDSEHVTRGQDEVLLARVLHLGAAVLAVQPHAAALAVDRHALGPGVVKATRAHRHDFALLGLLLGGVRDDQPGRGGLVGLEGTDHDAVLERLDYYRGGGRHDLTSPFGKANGGVAEEDERGRLSSRVPDCLVALALY